MESFRSSGSLLCVCVRVCVFVDELMVLPKVIFGGGGGGGGGFL